MGKGKWPAVHCLCMRKHSLINLGICVHVHLEIVSKIFRCSSFADMGSGVYILTYIYAPEPLSVKGEHLAVSIAI